MPKAPSVPVASTKPTPQPERRPPDAASRGDQASAHDETQERPSVFAPGDGPWFGDSEQEGELESSASVSMQPPYFFRVYRAFLTARAALSVMLFGLWIGLNGNGVGEPVWVPVATLAYALLAWGLWASPSQRRPTSADMHKLKARQAWASIGIDLVFFSAIHVLTDFTLNTQALLVLPVLMAAVLMSRRTALGAAAAATLSLLGSAWWRTQGHDFGVNALSQAGMTGIGLFAMAMLANELALRLASEEKNARGSRQLAMQQAELSRLVLEEMSEGVMVVDRRARVRAANPAARRLISWRGQSPAAPFSLRRHPAWAPLVKAIESAKSRPLQAEAGQEVRLHFDDHGARELRVRLRFVQNDTDAAREDVCVMLLEDLRAVRIRQRQDKLAAMGRMTAGLAHEIRNPLAAIAQGNALMAEDASQPEQLRLTQLVAANVARLQRIVEDILNAAPGLRPAAPLIDPIETAIALCNEWRSMHQLPSGPDSLLEIDLRDVAAHWGSGHKIRFEPDHLQRILVNLLDNALRHQSKQPGSILVSLRWNPSGPTGGVLMLSVASDGEPISVEAERSLFEPFFSTSSRGTGLGLYICRELCERHGASIDYRQHPPAVRHRNEFFLIFPVETPSSTT